MVKRNTEACYRFCLFLGYTKAEFLGYESFFTFTIVLLPSYIFAYIPQNKEDKNTYTHTSKPNITLKISRRMWYSVSQILVKYWFCELFISIPGGKITYKSLYFIRLLKGQCRYFDQGVQR